jgi:hypothetical protein
MDQTPPIGARNREKTHCDRGHIFDAANTRVYRGKRICRTCAREWIASRRPQRPDLMARLQRFLSPEPNTGCWLWLGAINPKTGYGTLCVGRRAKGERRTVYAHRASFELFRGPIAAGLQLDHLCGVRCCVNPDHLEPVTQTENVRRGIRRRKQCSTVAPRVET